MSIEIVKLSRPCNNRGRSAIPGLHAGWDDYVKALEKQNQWFRRESKHSLSVLGITKSYRHTISVLRDVIRRDWNTLQEPNQKRLLGLTPEADGWRLLGKMWHSARQSVFQIEANRKKIETAVRKVVKAPDDDDAFLDVVIEAYQEIRSIKGVCSGIASRLLTLARPDRCVSVNDGSREGLATEFGPATEFGLAPNTLGRTENYEELLLQLYERRWFKAQKPKDRREQKIWTMRAALIDCFVYCPKPPSDKHRG